jgi:hypothetical protein
MPASVPELPDESESSLLRAAQFCCEAIKELNRNAGSHTLIPFAILAGQGMEATLKCHLLQKRRSLEDVRGLGHDLIAAWSAAATAGPPIIGPAPDWLVVLNWGHARPFVFRYPPDMYGIAAPKAEDLLHWWPPVLRQLYRTSDRL